MSTLLAKQIIFSLLSLLPFARLIAQNIKGFTVLVGADAPAFIIFNSEVKNVEFLTPDANKYYINKVRSDNSLSISYKRESKVIPTNIELTVQEGKRHHVFLISFKKDYNINRDPILMYDYTDLKALKDLVQERGELNAQESQRLAEQDQKKQKESRIEEAETSRKKQKREQEKSKQDLEAAKKREAAKQAQFEKDLAKAKEEERKKADEVRKAEAAVKQKKAAEQEKARLDEERRKKEHDSVLARVQQLEKEKKEKDEAAKYTRVGLWKRYGSKGVNVFDLPPKQIDLVNAEFFLEKDTLRNYGISQEILTNKNDLLNTPSEKTSGGVSLALKSITFRGANVYFKILISNKSKDDFLMGLTGVYWYLQDGSPKMWLNCSYITYTQNFPIVPPGRDTAIVMVTRDANIQDDESLVISMSERRADKERLEIRLEGKIYNKEKMKIEQDVKQEVKKKKNKKRR